MDEYERVCVYVCVRALALLELWGPTGVFMN